MNNKLSKWKLLFSELEIDFLLFAGDNIKCSNSLLLTNNKELEIFAYNNGFTLGKETLSILSESEIENYQYRIGVTLPKEYNEFCTIFGSGGFEPNECGIECPNIYNIEEQIRINKYLLQTCKECTEWSNENKELLDSAYLFGQGQDEISFIFDLRTYSQKDLSYDIYGVNTEDGIVHYIGRDFFKFVRDICIGKRLKSEFPELITKITNTTEGKKSIDEITTFFPCPIWNNIEEN